MYPFGALSPMDSMSPFRVKVPNRNSNFPGTNLARLLVANGGHRVPCGPVLRDCAVLMAIRDR